MFLPADLLRRAQRCSGTGITDTVRQGLALVGAGDSYDKLLGLRGKVDVRPHVRALRADRK